MKRIYKGEEDEFLILIPETEEDVEEIRRRQERGEVARSGNIADLFHSDGGHDPELLGGNAVDCEGVPDEEE